MHSFTFAFTAIAAFAGVAFSQDSGFDSIYKPSKAEDVPAGASYTVAWELGSNKLKGPVTLTLLAGADSTTLQPAGTIGHANNEDLKFEWLVNSTLGTDALYGISIALDADSTHFQYSPGFHIVGGKATTSSSSPSSPSSSSSPSSAVASGTTSSPSIASTSSTSSPPSTPSSASTDAIVSTPTTVSSSSVATTIKTASSTTGTSTGTTTAAFTSTAAVTPVSSKSTTLATSATSKTSASTSASASATASTTPVVTSAGNQQAPVVSGALMVALMGGVAAYFCL